MSEQHINSQKRFLISEQHTNNQTGIVKWFNSMKGYGFISPNTNENQKHENREKKDVFVHIKALLACGLQELIQGQKVKYCLESSRGKVSAVNLEVLDE